MESKSWKACLLGVAFTDYLLWLFFAGYLSFSVWMLNGVEL